MSWQRVTQHPTVAVCRYLCFPRPRRPKARLHSATSPTRTGTRAHPARPVEFLPRQRTAGPVLARAFLGGHRSSIKRGLRCGSIDLDACPLGSKWPGPLKEIWTATSSTPPSNHVNQPPAPLAAPPGPTRSMPRAAYAIITNDRISNANSSSHEGEAR